MAIYYWPQPKQGADFKDRAELFKALYNALNKKPPAGTGEVLAMPGFDQWDLKNSASPFPGALSAGN